MNKTLLDNTANLKMVDVLRECIAIKETNRIRIATGFWDLQGMTLIKDELKDFFQRDGAKLQMIIGKDPFLYASMLNSPKYAGKHYPDEFIRTGIDEVAENLKEEYKETIQLLLNYCSEENKKIEIHIFKKNEDDESQFFHSKCYIFTSNDDDSKDMQAIVGSSNFTEKGLNGNSELNVLENDPYMINAAKTNARKGHIVWFEEKWEQSTDWTKEFLEQVLKPSAAAKKVEEEHKRQVQSDVLTPYELYIKLLQTKFGSLVDKDLNTLIEGYLPAKIDNYSYQIDAVKQCFTVMREHGGFMLADVVGLGKTIVGTLIIKHFLQFPEDDGRERKVLIVTPPAIKSGWKKTIELFDKDTTDRILPNIDFITTGSIGSLVDEVAEDDDSQDSGSFVDELKHENYGLIIVDESHKFRNSETAMYRALDGLISEIFSETGFCPYVGLLSATPQNNKPDDLKNQIYLFERSHNSSTLTKADNGNIEHFFATISAEYNAIIHSTDNDPESMRKHREELKVLSQKIRDCVLTDIMVRRTRTDIKKYYSSDTERQKLRFPTIKGPISLEYTMDRQMSKLFADTIDYICPSIEYKLSGSPYLGYYRYRAIQYLVSREEKSKYDARGSRTADALAEQLAKIMMINLVKRLESSFSAFHQSLRNLRQYTLNMLTMWQYNTIFICPQINVNEELDFKVKTEKRHKQVTFEDCINDIREKIKSLDETGKNIDGRNKEYTRADFAPEYCQLLQDDFNLLTELCDRWAQNDEDPKKDVFKDNLKSVLFNKETNIPQKLVIFSEAIDTVNMIKRVAENKGYRVLDITAANRDAMETVIRENFDANYGEVDGEEQKNDYDIIVTTEVLAEGVNLHRANAILNYDTPWNSTRLMQRIGRVNRIGSTQDFVYVYNFKPSAEGDAEINLVQKAYTKLQSFHTLFGEDNKVFTVEEEVSHYDLNTIVNGDESPLEKYIYELKNYKENNPERYAYIQQKEDNLESAIEHLDGCSYFMLKTSKGANLFIKVDPLQQRGAVISTAAMFTAFELVECAESVSLPENWAQIKKWAERAGLSHLNSMLSRAGNSNKATKAKGILRSMHDNQSISQHSKTLIGEAFTMVSQGNHDVIRKVLAFNERISDSTGELFGSFTQQDFDDMIEREMSKVLSNVSKQHGEAKVYLGLAK